MGWKWGLRAERTSGLEDARYIKPRARDHHGTTGDSDGGTCDTRPNDRWALPHHSGRCKEQGQHPVRCYSSMVIRELGSPLWKGRRERRDHEAFMMIRGNPKLEVTVAAILKRRVVTIGQRRAEELSSRTAAVLGLEGRLEESPGWLVKTQPATRATSRSEWSLRIYIFNTSSGDSHAARSHIENADTEKRSSISEWCPMNRPL